MIFFFFFFRGNLLKKNIMNFFFFFWESRPHNQVLFQEKELQCIPCYKGGYIIRDGLDPTCSSLLNLERLARKWETELPKRLTWSNLQNRKSAAKTRLSCMTWPYSDDAPLCPAAPWWWALHPFQTLHQKCTAPWQTIKTSTGKSFHRCYWS